MNVALPWGGLEGPRGQGGTGGTGTPDTVTRCLWQATRTAEVFEGTGRIYDGEVQ